MTKKLSVKWSGEAIADLKHIFFNLKESNSTEIALKIRKEIFNSPYGIVFPEQYQSDEFFPKYRRIIIRNYKVFYEYSGEHISVVGVFNSFRHPSKMRR